MVAWVLSACSRPELLGLPQIVQPVAEVPYARRLALRFDRPVVLRGEATDGEHTIEVEAASSAAPTFSLVGLYADREWTVAMDATDERGRTTEVELSFETAPLPETFPNVERLASEGGEPGFTLVPLISAVAEGWLVALDAAGEVAWLWEDGGEKFLEARPVEGGLLALQGETRLVEAGWDGEVLRAVEASEALPIFHHELAAQPDGTWLTLSRETREVSDYPLSYTVPGLRGAAEVAADRVVVVDPDSGGLVEEVRLADVLDLGRIGYGSLNGDAFGLDWTHANAACADDGAWVVSLRHQDAVVAIDRATLAVRWILGNHDNWGPDLASRLLEPTGVPFAWQYHQHAVKCLGDGRFLLFDNGNEQTSPWTGIDPVPVAEVRSRVVRYRVDEAAMTVAQEWVYAPEPALASPIMGDADALPGGDVLATFAHVDFVDGVPSADLGRGGFSFQVHEVDPDSGRLVWGVDVWAPSDAAVPEWRSFRAERFATFGAGGPTP